MFNMLDRGHLAEVLYTGQNAAELRSLDGKSCLHSIFHFAHSAFFFVCILILALLLWSISLMITHSFTITPSPYLIFTLSFFPPMIYYGLYVYVCVFAWVGVDVHVDLCKLNLFFHINLWFSSQSACYCAYTCTQIYTCRRQTSTVLEWSAGICACVHRLKL